MIHPSVAGRGADSLQATTQASTSSPDDADDKKKKASSCGCFSGLAKSVKSMCEPIPLEQEAGHVRLARMREEAEREAVLAKERAEKAREQWEQELLMIQERRKNMTAEELEKDVLNYFATNEYVPLRRSLSRSISASRSGLDAPGESGQGVTTEEPNADQAETVEDATGAASEESDASQQLVEPRTALEKWLAARMGCTFENLMASPTTTSTSWCWETPKDAAATEDDLHKPMGALESDKVDSTAWESFGCLPTASTIELVDSMAEALSKTAEEGDTRADEVSGKNDPHDVLDFDLDDRFARLLAKFSTEEQEGNADGVAAAQDEEATQKASEEVAELKERSARYRAVATRVSSLAPAVEGDPASARLVAALASLDLEQAPAGAIDKQGKFGGSPSTTSTSTLQLDPDFRGFRAPLASITAADVCWALCSEKRRLILERLLPGVKSENRWTWPELRRSGVGWWLCGPPLKPHHDYNPQAFGFTVCINNAAGNEDFQPRLNRERSSSGHVSGHFTSSGFQPGVGGGGGGGGGGRCRSRQESGLKQQQQASRQPQQQLIGAATPQLELMDMLVTKLAQSAVVQLRQYEKTGKLFGAPPNNSNGDALLVETSSGAPDKVKQRLADLAVFWYTLQGIELSKLRALVKTGVLQAEPALTALFTHEKSGEPEFLRKNAFRLLQLHRFHLAAALFLLANSWEEAAGVAARHLQDLQLMLVLTRRRPDVSTKVLQGIWEDLPRWDFNSSSLLARDVYLRMLLAWHLSDEAASVKLLQQVGNTFASLTNNLPPPLSSQSDCGGHGCGENQDETSIDSQPSGQVAAAAAAAAAASAAAAAAAAAASASGAVTAIVNPATTTTSSSDKKDVHELFDGSLRLSSSVNVLGLAEVANAMFGSRVADVFTEKLHLSP
eukprot:CAMPEP_0206596662 /NCGR_PEP_ID=MMETSP0325_2-20121206/43682_1 /ASSEMBLY_ACC=CAM_ASM_000347 /TAXON_ID=2866 /ORGANISM="Crypthecodinium cohnii, Strain Seligo" /LENGTH=903 /DNA_ID=CAMNT_0054107515 /DNA_START=66 /DNA_END=2777 /DNA_ORIENTATION=+